MRALRVPAARYSIYLLYWYKSTNTEGRGQYVWGYEGRDKGSVLNSRALLVQEYEY
jgi:hypothetical protein